MALYSSLILHVRHFRKKSTNRCKKGAQTFGFWVQKQAVGASGSIDSFILVDFGGFKQLLIFRCWFWAPKSRSGKLRSAPASSGRIRPAPTGRPGASTQFPGFHREGGKGGGLSKKNNLNAGPRRVGGSLVPKPSTHQLVIHDCSDLSFDF